MNAPPACAWNPPRRARARLSRASSMPASPSSPYQRRRPVRGLRGAAASQGRRPATLLGTPRQGLASRLHRTRASRAGAARPPQAPAACRPLKLQPHEWFAMALCGENESSYLLNLALAELQSPGALRPGLHSSPPRARPCSAPPLRPSRRPTTASCGRGSRDRGEGPMPTRSPAVAPELGRCSAATHRVARHRAARRWRHHAAARGFREQIPTLATMPAAAPPAT